MANTENLLNEYGAAVYGFCIRLAKDRHDADDLYQQTMLTALEKDIDRAKNPKAYLMKICVSIYKNERRKRARRERIAPCIPIDQNNDEVFSKSVEEMTEEKLLSETLCRLIDKLDEKHRITLLLYYGVGKNVNETAQALNCSSGTVKSRLYTAREILKKGLEAEGYDR